MRKGLDSLFTASMAHHRLDGLTDHASAMSVLGIQMDLLGEAKTFAWLASDLGEALSEIRQMAHDAVTS